MSAESRARLRAVTREPQPRLDLALLLIAAESMPNDAATGRALESMLAHGCGALDSLAGGVPNSGRADQRLRAALGDMRGDDSDYLLLESSLLPAVLARGRGLPILLSCIWTETARRVGIASYGVGLPGHFVVGIGDPDTFPDGPRLLVDPARGGRLLPYDSARDLVERSSAVFRREHLRPHDPIATIGRVLGNVMRWAEPIGRATTRLWAADLALLLPRHDAEVRRTRAVALLALGRTREAAAEFESYAAAIEPAAPEQAQRARALSRRALASLN